MHEYENTKRIQYEGGATFIPVCSKCGQFVKADKEIMESDNGIEEQPNADCKKCGRAEMIFEGYI